MTVDGFGFGTLTGESCLKNVHCHTDRASWDAIVTVSAWGGWGWGGGGYHLRGGGGLGEPRTGIMHGEVFPILACEQRHIRVTSAGAHNFNVSLLIRCRGTCKKPSWPRLELAASGRPRPEPKCVLKQRGDLLVADVCRQPPRQSCSSQKRSRASYR